MNLDNLFSMIFFLSARSIFTIGLVAWIASYVLSGGAELVDNVLTTLSHASDILENNNMTQVG